MKINSIEISNFIGARHVIVDLERPISLFCGSNGAGKSSISEAVRMALTGESVRVALKKNYSELVSSGRENGGVRLSTSEGDCSIALPSGDGAHFKDLAALSYVLDAQRFASLTASERRSFLFGLMGVKTGLESTKARMIELGAAAEKVDVILPYLRGGFDAAHKEAQAKAREEKAVWRNITGETYGEKKAESWARETVQFDQAALDKLTEKSKGLEQDLRMKHQRLGALEAQKTRFLQVELDKQRLGAIREKAQKYARIQDKLLKDEDELKAWQAKVDAAKQSENGGRKIGVVHEMARALHDFNDLMDDSNGVDGYHLNDNVAAWGEFEFARNVPALLEKYAKEHGEIGEGIADEEEKSKLPEYEKALQLMQNAVGNGKRDQAEADEAAKRAAEIEKMVAETEDPTDEIELLRKNMAQAEEMHAQALAEIKHLEKANEQAKQSADATQKAKDAHLSVVELSKIADMLSPDGIPKELMTSALGPINACLSEYCVVAEWGTVEIDQDMGIRYARKDYSMLSESEKWRVDALIAAAVSKLSGLGLLTLDRFDVLDAKGREDLLVLLNELVDRGQIQTAMIFGTLNKVPTNLPPNFEVFNVKNGEISE
jgi:energy-coupling factor transporter ATP-binding protein EcfA2